MRSRGLTALLLLTTIAGCRRAVPAGARQENAPLARRDLWLTLEAEVREVPAGATELVFWIPVPRDEPSQALRQITPDATARGEVVVDEVHRNPALRVLFADPGEDGSEDGTCAAAHAPFVALARAAGIPARLRGGFEVPEAGPNGRLAGEAGEHCWAEYLSKTDGWTPVDVRRKAFGALDPHRIGMSLGHGTKFEGQTGAPVDSFVLPYAEVDGSPVEVTTRATWSERR